MWWFFKQQLFLFPTSLTWFKGNKTFHRDLAFTCIHTASLDTLIFFSPLPHAIFWSHVWRRSCKFVLCSTVLEKFTYILSFLFVGTNGRVPQKDWGERPVNLHQQYLCFLYGGHHSHPGSEGLLTTGTSLPFSLRVGHSLTTHFN